MMQSLLWSSVHSKEIDKAQVTAQGGRARPLTSVVKKPTTQVTDRIVHSTRDQSRASKSPVADAIGEWKVGIRRPHLPVAGDAERETTCLALKRRVRRFLSNPKEALCETIKTLTQKRESQFEN
jgi:hypothetical protein